MAKIAVQVHCADGPVASLKSGGERRRVATLAPATAASPRSPFTEAFSRFQAAAFGIGKKLAAGEFKPVSAVTGENPACAASPRVARRGDWAVAPPGRHPEPAVVPARKLDPELDLTMDEIGGTARWLTTALRP
ncbi:MAG: hypothetical protein OXI87_24065 [Albidovulum sp.]|nr:hypothetical protein [Albidovulum sp.]MDE0530794.1 hypothetical protein [Albidovulum sp.]